MYRSNRQNKKTGLWYAYDCVSYRDPVTKKARQKCVCVGRYNPETGATTPTDGRMIKAREKNQQAELSEMPVSGCLDYTRKYCGSTYLLSEISKKLEITQDLQQYFPDTYDKILSLAMYLILGKSRAFCNFDQFDAHYKHPHNRNISSQRISELLQKISQEQVLKFVQQLKKHHNETEYWAYDSTSISSYSTKLNQVKYGHSKEKNGLAHFNFALLFSQEKHFPFYYRKYAGNIPDTKSMCDLLSDLDDNGYQKVKIVTDKGYFSIKNVNALLESGHDFLIAPKMNLNFIKGEFNRYYDSIKSFTHYNIYQNVYSLTIKHDWEYQVPNTYTQTKEKKTRQLYIHLYYNPVQKEKEEKNLNRKLHDLRQELLEGKHNKKNEKDYKRYFVVTGDGENRCVIAKDDEINQTKKYYGYMALLSSEELSSMEALEIYRNKDIIEKAFGHLKDKQGFRRPLVTSEKSLDGKLFIEYIALILLAYLKKQIYKAKLGRKYTMEKIFNTLDTIECHEYKNKEIRYTTILEIQEKLYKDLDIQTML